MIARLNALLLTLAFLVTLSGCPLGLQAPGGVDPDDDDDASGSDDDDSAGDDDDSTAGDDDDATGDDDDATGDDDDATGDDDDATGDDDDATGDDDDATGDDDDATGDDDDSTGTTLQCDPLTTFTSANGTFSDGSGGSDYDNNLQCGWLIDVDPNSWGSVTLSFTAFDVESGYDFVNVYDGADANAPLLQALSGSSLPADVTSTGAQLYVEFVTDSTVTAGGFDAAWVANTGGGTTTGCTGTTTLTGATGTFDDGSTTGDYDNNLTCGWLIDTDASLYGSVTLSFSSFDVENTYDFVNVYDGADANAPLLQALTGTTLPADITSSSSQIFVELVTDSIVTADGFTASWVANPIGAATCSGTTTLTGATGTFEDGSGAGDYTDNLSCGWLIDTDATLYQDVTLSFSAFDVDTADVVNVYDGADASAALLMSLSGASLPADITSTGPQLFVELVTDSAGTAAGFDASWVANPIVLPPTCSGTTTLTGATGTFEDGSGVGVDYDNSLQCGWLIDVDATLYQDITLSFSAFDVENTFDFVNVYDGADANAPLLVSLTGTTLPADVTSTTSQLFVELVTDSTVTADGFEASWVANPIVLPPTCSGTTTLNGATGTFEDGSGAGVDYDNSLQCGWLIDVDATLYQDITLSFSAFDVENTFDFVNVYDGADANATLLMSLTGTSLPADITSSGPQIFVELVTDSSVGAEGFEASWVANPIVLPPTCSGTTTLTAGTGTFDDGSGAGVDYDNNLSCGWLIDVDPTSFQNVTLSFGAFDVENNFDFVNVYDGADASAPLLGAFTGTSLPGAVTSTADVLFVEFVTDGSVTAGGFEASWAGNPWPPTCSGTTNLSGATGTFDDGSGAGDYDNGLSCGWLIDVNSTLYQDVTLSFSSFDVENNFDFVNVYDGADANATLLVSLTGTSLPADVTSTGDQLFVELVTDGSVTAGGFEASWTANPYPATCSGTTTLTGATGTFEDGSGAGSYTNNLSCGWLIDVDASSYQDVTLTFGAFQVENNFDFVNVYDGVDANAPLLGSFTGSSAPGPITSSSDVLFIELVTDGSVTGAGFDASWVANPWPATCSGTTTYLTATGTFEDGSGTGDYDNNLSCGWLIDVDPTLYGSVTLSFSAFDVENSWDFVNVYDGPDANATLLGAFTGTSIPAAVTSSTNQLFVELVTDSSVGAGGFEASWVGNPVAGGCAGTTVLTAPSGSFDDGAGDYAPNSSCGWVIDVPGAEAVTLSFSSFATESGWDYVTVYAGTNGSGTVLADLSGTNVDTNVTVAANLGPIFVEFVSDGSVQMAGFVADYTTYGATDECSGNVTLTDPVGALSDGAGNYSNNSTCSWTIAVEDAAGIELTFGVLETEASFDFVDVFDGADDNAALLASYDGAQSSMPTLTSNGGQVFVDLDTDFSVTAPGFTATYEAVYVPCSGSRTLTATTGGFGDGGGPDANYDSNQTCSWAIDGTGGSAVQITAVYWDLESNWDWVDVYDGTSSSAPLLNSWTGSGTSDTWTTSGNQAFVEFTSDGTVTDAGFWIEYTIIP